MDVEVMPFYFWTCMWYSLCTVLVAVFDLCALMKHVTMFSEDIFAGCCSAILYVFNVDCFWVLIIMQAIRKAVLLLTFPFVLSKSLGLISLIFIIDGARPIIENFTESRLTLTNCMFEAKLPYAASTSSYFFRHHAKLRPLYLAKMAHGASDSLAPCAILARYNGRNFAR